MATDRWTWGNPMTTPNTHTWNNNTLTNNPWMDSNTLAAFRAIEARMLATELQLALLAEKLTMALERLAERG